MKVIIFCFSLLFVCICAADTKELPSQRLKTDISPLLYSCVRCHGEKSPFPIFENNKIKPNYNKLGLLQAIDLILDDRVFEYHSIKNAQFGVQKDLETAYSVLENQIYKKKKPY